MATRKQKLVAQAFLFGILWTVLLFAAINGVSYLVRSSGWGDLLGAQRANSEAIGFPFEIWSEPGNSNSNMLQSDALLRNLLVGLAACVPGALLWLLLIGRRLTNAIIRMTTREYDASTRLQTRLQFSLLSLLLVTTLVAMIVAGAKGSESLRRIYLGVIYVGGPWIIVFASWNARRLVARHRQFVISCTVLGLLLGALALGLSLPGIDDFTRVFLGIFVCWVPQCVLFGALAILSVRLGFCRRRN